MEYWLDGYNVIHRQGWLSKHTLAQARERLEKEVLLLATPVRLYFDARGDRSGSETTAESRSSAVTIVFCGSLTADERILQDLRLPRKGPVTVVTDDRELRGMAKQLKANTVGVERFAESLKKTGTPAPSQKKASSKSGSSDGKPTSLTQKDVAYWMRIFGFDEEDPKP
ncbi:MAG TPA: NYN domain-containing protein [Planctomycetota bacterium]|nr:NYN domain-containing protein [Planctomycetota bacterium]